MSGIFSDNMRTPVLLIFVGDLGLIVQNGEGSATINCRPPTARASSRAKISPEILSLI